MPSSLIHGIRFRRTRPGDLDAYTASRPTNELIPSKKKQTVRSLDENHFVVELAALYLGSKAFQFGAASIQSRADFLHDVCHRVLVLESIPRQVCQSQFQESAL